jgi:hypothetical protein
MPLVVVRRFSVFIVLVRTICGPLLCYPVITARLGAALYADGTMSRTSGGDLHRGGHLLQGSHAIAAWVTAASEHYRPARTCLWIFRAVARPPETRFRDPALPPAGSRGLRVWIPVRLGIAAGSGQTWRARAWRSYGELLRRRRPSRVGITWHALQQHVCEPVHLIQGGDGWIEDELVHPELLEGGRPVADLLRSAHGSPSRSPRPSRRGTGSRCEGCASTPRRGRLRGRST